MKLKRFKERNNKQKVILIFTIACVLLITGVFLYKTFAIFQTNLNEDMIEGEVQDIGDLEFAFYIDDGKEDKISKTAPKKDDGYSLDTSSSYCKDMTTGKQTGSINWNQERWEPYLSNITTTKTKCYLHFKKIYEENTLNGATPDLMNGRLVPIKISDNIPPSDITYVGAQAGKVEKADITSEWYNYGKQQWANAVILRDGKEDNYQPGEEIEEKDIESYFVWIPRYSYQLKNNKDVYNGYSSTIDVGNVENVSKFYEKHQNEALSNVFEITFETKDKGNKQGSLKGDSITHPAFVAFDSNGFWVGKFETGYNQNSNNDNVTPVVTTWSTEKAQQNTEDSSKIIIKPHVYSWRGINASNAFYASYDYKRELESHVMKNTEWGAVAYLTQSKYGRCLNGNCTEINRNNSEYFITGMSTTKEATCGSSASKLECNWYGGPSTLNELESGFIKSYYLKDSQGGSTTGNYSGIYDMSGGAYDYVMGVMQGTENGTKAPASGRNNVRNSNFKGPYSGCEENGGNDWVTATECYDTITNTTGKEWPSAKYYDLYDYKNGNNVDYQRGILGDATKEMGPFYSVSYDGGTTRKIGSFNADIAFFMAPENPWFVRGGCSLQGTDTGIFSFSSYDGVSDRLYSFRIVLTP